MFYEKGKLNRSRRTGGAEENQSAVAGSLQLQSAAEASQASQMVTMIDDSVRQRGQEQLINSLRHGVAPVHQPIQFQGEEDGDTGAERIEGEIKEKNEDEVDITIATDLDIVLEHHGLEASELSEFEPLTSEAMTQEQNSRENRFNTLRESAITRLIDGADPTLEKFVAFMAEDHLATIEEFEVEEWREIEGYFAERVKRLELFVAAVLTVLQHETSNGRAISVSLLHFLFSKHWHCLKCEHKDELVQVLQKYLREDREHKEAMAYVDSMDAAGLRR